MSGRRTRVPLSNGDMMYILEHAERMSVTEIAERLGRSYNTVAVAIRRASRGQVRYRLTWHPCTECGKPISGPIGRTAHRECETARTVRYGRESRRRRPGQSTPYVRRFREENPKRVRELREQERESRREQWPELPEEVREASLEKAHAADRRDYPVTRERADASRQPWTEGEDRAVLERMGDPAREVALDLGRTLWAVRARRVRLRREGLAGVSESRRRGRSWWESHIEELRTLAPAEFARRHGTTLAAVYSARSELGLAAERDLRRRPG